MKNQKILVSFTSAEYRLMVHGLIHFRNKIIRQGGFGDAINELCRLAAGLSTSPSCPFCRCLAII